MFDLDLGNEGGAAGPFLAWSARGTLDGVIPQRSFFLRDSGNRSVFDMSKGIVLDIEKMKTGWQHSEGIAGVAPEWKWNPSVNQMMPSPGEGWKKGFSIPCAIGGGDVATWEQAGAAVWQALADLAPKLSDGGGKLPLVRMSDAKALQFKKGSTIVPVLEVVKWVDRPDCLKEGAAAGIAMEPAPIAKPAPAVAAEDLEF